MSIRRTPHSFKPPPAAARAAARGLALRRQFGRGGTAVGVARARDLKNRRNVSPTTIKRMVSYFARHAVDQRAPGFGDTSKPTNGYIAWLLWGGDVGRKWAENVKRSLVMLLLLIGLAFGFSSTTQAQGPPDSVPFEEPLIVDEIIEDDFDPSALMPIRSSGYQEVQGSQADSFYGIIHYDIYERAYHIDDFFPLGYRATVTYDYYPRLYETKRGWEPVVSREASSFRRGQKAIASYVKTFNTSGQRTSYTRQGFSVMAPIMKTIGSILGLEFKLP